MLAKEYRRRYAVVLLLSLFVHVVALVSLYLQPAKPAPEDTREPSVQIKLKTKKPPEPVKKPKSEKPEPKIVEPKKTEPKKTEPKKTEPKKTEPKKTEPKKAEPKKAEPKKTEPKKTEPKKTDSKKTEPKKTEPKKTEPKKAEPKKAEPKKAEPKKAEPKKAQAKQPKPGQSAPSKQAQVKPLPSGGAPEIADKREKAAPFNPTRKPVNKPKPSEDVNSLAYWTKKWGSATQLDEKKLRRAIVYSEGNSRVFAEREKKAQQLEKGLSRREQTIFNRDLARAANHIIKFIQIPDIESPGRPFRGEIKFLLDKNGYITKMNFRRSGIPALDEAMKKAVEDSQPIPLPRDPKILEVFMVKPKIFYYDERDLP